MCGCRFLVGCPLDSLTEVRRIDARESYDLLLNRHYARRIPSISYCFGLFREGKLAGVVTYGTPSSAPLRSGVCGKDCAGLVKELNRLCLVDNLKNDASFLVSKSMAMLPKPTIVVSFADTSQGHVGFVYQACNFVYTGLSAKRTDWKVRGMEHLHGQTIADKFRGVENRAEKMREVYGDDFYIMDRPRKHRYVFVVGSKSQKKALMAKLLYKPQPYPKA